VELVELLAQLLDLLLAEAVQRVLGLVDCDCSVTAVAILGGVCLSYS